MGAGRPTDYRAEYCERVIEIGRDGGSVVAMAEACDTLKQRLHEWAKVNPEFQDAFTRARQLSQLWWENVGKNNVITPQGMQFNNATWAKNMSCRFRDDWTDTTKNIVAGDAENPLHTKTDLNLSATLTIDQIKNTVAEILGTA